MSGVTKEDQKRRQVIIILEQAALETVKTSKGYQLLNCDDHKGLHKKLNREPSQSRPDILHQELMAVLDSPLNKAGYLKVYIRSTKDVLIDVSSQMRVPRTYKRFAGLMGRNNTRITSCVHGLRELMRPCVYYDLNDSATAPHAQDPLVGRQPDAAQRDQEPRDQVPPGQHQEIWCVFFNITLIKSCARDLASD